MNEHDMTEQAYKNGYEDGKRDAVKHGRWIGVEEKMWNVEFPVVTSLECSVCGTEGYSNYNFCPNCGARMDGDGNA